MDGTSRESIGNFLSGVPEGIALDIAAAKMYVAAGTGINTSRIYVSNLDGTNGGNLAFLPDSGDFNDVALDPVHQKIYWTTHFGTQAGTVERGNLDGTGRESIGNFLSGRPEGIALDITAGKMYVAAGGGINTSRIYVANLDGTNGGNLAFLPDSGDFNDIALDLVHQKIYWTTHLGTQAGLVERANLDGTARESIGNFISGVPEGIALDIAAGKTYVTAGTGINSSRIYVSNLDGTNGGNLAFLPEVGDFNDIALELCLDSDADVVCDTSDNCPFVFNPDQSNNDRNFIDNSPPYLPAVDDLTLANSDAMGDACDLDDDNDGLADTTETNLVALQLVCPTASAVTDPLKLDTDGDHITDGAECAMGSDPANIASRPAIPTMAQDPDNDRLSTAFETLIGTNPALSDTDGDGVPDGIEYKGYGSNPLVVDTDSDGIRDRCEVASLNADTIVNSGDQTALATEIMRNVSLTGIPKLANFDLNKDAVLNSGDQALQATAVGPGKCP